MRVGNFLQWEKISGEPLTVENVRVTPQTSVLSVRLPFGAFVWNRPVSVVVERGTRRETLPVPDVTLISGIVFAVAVMAVPLFFMLQQKGARK